LWLGRAADCYRSTTVGREATGQGEDDHGFVPKSVVASLSAHRCDFGSLSDQDFQLPFTPKYFCAHIIAMSRQMKIDDRCSDPEVSDLDIIQERW
jgi:hypothetical protein